MPEYRVGKTAKRPYITAGSIEMAEALAAAHEEEYGEPLNVYDMAGRRADRPRRRS